jgi:hypothetical protein
MKILNSDLELQAHIKPIDALIEEEINRAFTLSFSTVLDEKSEYINHNNIVEIEDNYFNITYFKKNRNDSLTIEADCEHISYDLNKEEYDKEFFTADGTPEYILGKILEGTGFTIGTIEFTNVQTFSIQEPMSRRGLLVLFAEYLGGELLFEKYTISILQSRGQDKGVQFKVGKNIRGISKEVDNRKPVNGLPKIAYDVDVIELSELPEYGDLEKVSLGDTVKVIDPDLDIEVDQRIVKYGYNPIRKINSTVEIANFIDDLSDTIFNIQRTTVIKEKVYNGIKIGPENGFEAIRSDKKARTVMNATEGIKIQKGDGLGAYTDVIFLDTNGNAVFQGKVQASDFVGGTIDIGTGAFTVDNQGNITVTMGSINLGSGTFTVDNLGNMVATSGYFNGDIEGSTITGSILQTFLSGRRITIEGNQLNAYDQNDTVRISLAQATSNNVNYYELKFYGENGTQQGTISATNGQMNLTGLSKLLLGNAQLDGSLTKLGGTSQSDSVAIDVDGLRADFNTLLSKLRSMKILA